MLIEFKAANFRSLCEPAVLSMVASHLTARQKRLDRDNLVPRRDELSLLKTAAIYGANAGGKSNFVRALRFMRDFVLTSSRETQIGDPIRLERPAAYYRLATGQITRVQTCHASAPYYLPPAVSS